MHPGSLIPEIRCLVFGQCDRRDLARLARCCKTLTELATDELWAEIRSFQPFLCCLPSDLRTATCDLRLGDLQRLDHYARKVRAIHMDRENACDTISLPGQFASRKIIKQERRKKDAPPQKSWKEVWTSILTLRSNTEFLPNLRSLHVSVIVEEMLYPLLGISGAKLEHIYVNYLQNREPESIVHRFLDQLGDVSKLEYLFVRYGEPDHVPLKVLQNAPLKRLWLEPRAPYKGFIGGAPLWPSQGQLLRPEMMLQIKSLEHLTTGLTPEWNGSNDLGLNSTERSVFVAPHSEICLLYRRRSCLPALRSLWLDLTMCGPELSGKQSPSVFFERLNFPTLESLRIYFFHKATRRMLLDTIRAVRNNCKLHLLKELVLSPRGLYRYSFCSRTTPEPEISPYDQREALLLMLPLPGLQLLRLSLVSDLLQGFNPELYTKLASGLPALKTLQIARDRSPRGRRHPRDYEGTPLHHVAALCHLLPSLEHVDVGVIDGRALEDWPREEWRCPQIKTLQIDEWMEVEGRSHRLGVSENSKMLALLTYFPNSDYTKTEAEAYKDELNKIL